MNRWMYGLLAAVCLTLLMVPAVWAADTDIVNYPVTGGNIQFDKSTGAVTDCDTSVTEVDIPVKIEGVSVISIDKSAFESCYSLTKVSIPNSVTSIGYEAFWCCYSLTSVTIPNSVTSIEELAFYGCDRLTKIMVAADNPFYTSIDGVLLNKTATILHIYPSGRSGAYSIPDSVTAIDNYAFYCCTSLTNVTIPDSVISIGHNAFAGCEFTSVTIPNNVTSIDEEAFYTCLELTSVTIPNSVTFIGPRAFAYCTSLTDVYYIGTQAEYEANLRPNVQGKSSNSKFLNATFHFSDSPNLQPPTPNPNPTLPNTAAKDNTTVYGIAFLVLFALTLTVWARGRRREKDGAD